MKKAIPAIIAIVLICVIIAATLGIKLMEKYSYSRERADLEEYFDIEDEQETAIILQDEMIPEKALLMDGVYYFSLETVHAYLNERFYEDFGEGLLLYTTPDAVIRTEVGSTVSTSSLDGKPSEQGYILSRYKGDVLYIAADYVKQFTNFSYETFSEPNRMQVYTVWDERTVADVKKDTAVRYQGGVKSEILADVSKGTTLTILEEMENWSKVKTKDAFIGYVENKRLGSERTETPEPVTDYEEPVYTSISKDYKINMAWHQVTTRDANASFANVVSQTQGLNTISPTWFSLSDNEGNFTSIASESYVAQAHQMGLEVWALIDNFNPEVDSFFVLASTKNRTRLIDGLVQTALDYGLDGINIDFENLSEKSGEHFIQFLRELSIPCRANGIVLSVDNYVPIGSNHYYGRKEQGVVADYVIIMGYDEHWAGCEEAGSVASIDFVESGIQKTLEEVPAEKVINAVPFYTRIWSTKGGKVSSEAVGMNSAENFLTQNGAQASWDEATCQNYGEFETEDTLYQVWLEDEQSIEVKLNVMRNYDLAGVAAWKLGFERPSIWNILDNYVNS